MKTFKTFSNALIVAILQFVPLFIQTELVARDRMVITGNVISFGGSGVPTATLIADDGGEMPVVIGPKGRFWVNVPVGTNYRFVFARPGCTSKVIDVCVAGQVCKIPARRIRFDVELFAGDDPEAIPAGRISFSKGTGRMLVEYGSKTKMIDPPPDQHSASMVQKGR